MANTRRRKNAKSEVIDDIMSEVQEAPEVVESIAEETPEVVETIVGVVCNCIKLNVRKEPKLTSPVICAVDAGAEVVIDDADSNSDFYKVTISSGVSGYCNKKFIRVK